MFTNIEEKGLREAGFKDDEMLELNSIKDAIDKIDSNLERAMSVAMTGLLYFAGGPVDVKIDGVELNDTIGGYRISATSKKGLHAPTAIVIVREEEYGMEPVEIQYGVRLNTDEPCTVNILEKSKFDGNPEMFAPCCLTYLKLSGYSFITDKGEVSRFDFLAGDPLKGIVQRPIDGDIDTINFVRVKNVSEEFELTKGA